MLECCNSQKSGVFYNHLVILDHIKKCTDQLVVRYGNDLIYICFNIREQLISRSTHCCTICNCIDTRKAYNMISL